MTAMRFAAILIVTSLALVAVAAPASAHASRNTEDGKYRITWGLLQEPGFTHEKNRLDLIIRELVDPAANRTGAGVDGVGPANVTIKLLYGEEVYEWGNVTNYRGAKSTGFAGPGNYTSTNYVYLTRPGIYALEIKGEIHGSPVDLLIPAAHDYEPMTEIMFPDEIEIGGGETDLSALEARIAALEAKQATQAATPADVNEQEGGSDIPALGLLAALGAVGVALALFRSRHG